MSKGRKNKEPNVNENDEVVIMFKITKEQFAKYEPIINALDVYRATFFKHLLLNKNYTYKESNKAEIKRMLFLVNKTSNNINQIAHRLNADNLSGIISQRTYGTAINELITIKQQLERIIDVSKS
ncbi:plasmid mobilization relaxosome protein MobC [Vibrio vulnificus]